jgi:hypothetical protein
MRAYTPSKKQLPSWMMMNETKHWMTSNDTDLELNLVDTSDGIEFSEEMKLTSSCRSNFDWVDPRGSACDRVSFMKPELKLRHLACDEEARVAGGVNGYVPSTRRGPHERLCRMTSSRSEKVYPEYAKCFKPGGMDGPNALDCRKACYTFPEQPGCEAINAETKDLWDVSKTARDAIIKWKTPEPVKEQINILRYAERDAARPPPVPAPEETVVIAASMKSVTPTAVQFSYVDPKTKKSVVVKKTLVDMYKPTDKVTVVLGKKTNKFVDLRKK